MQRLPDWEARLFAYLDDSARKLAEGKVEPSTRLCALFSAGAVMAQTGEDPTASFRGRYSKVKDNLEGALNELFPATLPGFARRGDVVWHDGSIGVVIGGDALFVADVNERPALIRLPREKWEKAWVVG